MPEANGGAPAGSAASAPESGAADYGQSGVGETGYAPGSSQDAATDEAAQGSSAEAQQVAEFFFNGHKYRDQAHAENAIQAMIGRVPQVQRENAMYQQQLAEMQSQMQALQSMIAATQGVQGGQGKQREAELAFADKLAKSGDLEFFEQLAQDPNIGIKGAFYAMMEAADKRAEEREQKFLETHLEPIQRQREFSDAMTRVNGSRRQLAEYFPELGDNDSEEGEAVAQEVLGILKGAFSPEYIAEKPELALSFAVLMYREMNGTPVFARPPGSSESPSAFAAQAAEAAASGPTPLDGSGVPRPGSGGHSPLDRIRRENREINSKVVRTPSGRPLFSA